jgi:hypothetical protein
MALIPPAVTPAEHTPTSQVFSLLKAPVIPSAVRIVPYLKLGGVLTCLVDMNTYWVDINGANEQFWEVRAVS